MKANTYIVQTLNECLEKCIALADNVNCENLKASIIRAQENTNQPMQLAIIGKISSSKSTLVNAILGKEEVVATDGMEMTYNVSWLKYGNETEDIKVVYKNDTTELIPRTEWKNWANRKEGGNHENIKYLEITYPHELLKSINIIDTPGLNSIHGTDSKNTIDFLKSVKPDAILLMSPDATFAQSVIDVLKEFQGRCINKEFVVSPLNAIGIFAKIDTHWSIDKDLTARQIVQPVIDACRQEVQIKDTLFSILPICSTLALACNSISNEDIDLLSVLSKEKDLYDMLESDRDFCDDDYVTEISLEDRCYLHHKFGLYGIYELTQAIKNGTSQIDDLKMLLKEISGFGTFLYQLNSHFGERATLIKAMNAVKLISYETNEIKLRPDSSDIIKKCCEEIESIINSSLLSLHDYKELNMLAKIYEGSYSTNDTEIIDEFKRVSGEYGYSIIDKLDGSINDSIDELQAKATLNMLKWHRNYNLCIKRDRNKSLLCKILYESYKVLSDRIDEMINEREQAIKKVNLINQFFYGEEKCQQ